MTVCDQCKELCDGLGPLCHECRSENERLSPPDKCYGFGPKLGKCSNKPGTNWSDHFCEECDQERMNHISARFDAIEEEFE